MHATRLRRPAMRCGRCLLALIRLHGLQGAQVGASPPPVDLQAQRAAGGALRAAAAGGVLPGMAHACRVGRTPAAAAAGCPLNVQPHGRARAELHCLPAPAAGWRREGGSATHASVSQLCAGLRGLPTSGAIIHAGLAGLGLLSGVARTQAKDGWLGVVLVGMGQLPSAGGSWRAAAAASAAVPAASAAAASAAAVVRRRHPQGASGRRAAAAAALARPGCSGGAWAARTGLHTQQQLRKALTNNPRRRATLPEVQPQVRAGDPEALARGRQPVARGGGGVKRGRTGPCASRPARRSCGSSRGRCLT